MPKFVFAKREIKVSNSVSVAGIGRFKDDIALLQRAIKFLEPVKD